MASAGTAGPLTAESLYRANRGRSGRMPSVARLEILKKRPQRRGNCTEAALIQTPDAGQGGGAHRGLSPALGMCQKRVVIIHQPENGSRNSGLF